MLDWLTDPWTSALMRRAFFEAMLVGGLCGVLGCFVLVRGLAFLGEAISHTVLLGVVLAFLVGAPSLAGGVALAIVTVMLTSAIANDSRFSVDTAMGILLPSLFGGGVVLIASSESYRAPLDDVLFGSILATTQTDLALAGAACALTAVVLTFAGKELVLVAFDRPVARAMGYRTALLDLLLLGAVALAVVVALKAVGNVLLAGLLLGPPVIARMLAGTFWRMAACSALVAVGAPVAGLYLSWYVEVGAGAAIVLVIAATFGAVAVGVEISSRNRLRRSRACFVTLLLSVGAFLVGCGPDDGRETAGGPGLAGEVEVVATTMQLQDFSRQVGGDRVRVVGILGPGDEPHEYEPTPADADAITDADVVVENGLNLDGWLDDLLSNAGGEATRVDASRNVELLPTEEEGFPGDPHVWHDPDNAKTMVDNVKAGLAKADPDGKATYEKNAEAYKSKIDRMALQIRTDLKAVAPNKRKLVTTHDAFGYFGRAYDIEIVGAVLPSVTTETETSGRRVRDLIDTIRREGVGVVFTERGVDPKLERQIAREAGVALETSLYADVLGAEGSGAEEFIDAERANATAMIAGFNR